MMTTTQSNKSLANRAERTEAQRFVAPAVDIYENKDEFLLVADLPGVTRETLNMHFDRNELRLEARRVIPEAAQGLSEQFQPADFGRSFALPHGIDAAKIEASLESGVLRVRLPKAEALKPRRIEVKSA